MINHMLFCLVGPNTQKLCFAPCLAPFAPALKTLIFAKETHNLQIRESMREPQTCVHIDYLQQQICHVRSTAA